MNMVSDEQVFHRTSTDGDIIRMVSNRLSVESILQALSIDKSLVLFNTIALASFESDFLISRLGFTRKQCELFLRWEGLWCGVHVVVIG